MNSVRVHNPDGVIYPLGVEESRYLSGQNYLTVYPNPIVDAASIVFSIRETTTINLSLYGSDGKELVTKFKGIAQAEIEYTHTFGRNDLTEGIYYLRLKAGKNTGLIRKLIVIN